MKKVMVIICSILVLGLVGCGPAPTGVKVQSTVAPVVETTKPVEKTVFLLNEVVKTSNGATIIISKLTKPKVGEYDSVKPGNEFVMVTVTITNSGKDIIAYNPFDYKMQNSQGQILDGTYSSVNENTALGTGNLAIGGKVTGTLLFEQPKNDKALTLVYTGNMFSAEGITFKLN